VVAAGHGGDRSQLRRGAGYEYLELVGHGFLPSSGLYGSTFYTMTGFHGFHVTMGVLCMIWVTGKAFRGGYTRADHRGVEVIGLYWHFVDLVWIILFTIVYLI
jgi:cytochrome c oxidase subunit III